MVKINLNLEIDREQDDIGNAADVDLKLCDKKLPNAGSMRYYLNRDYLNDATRKQDMMSGDNNSKLTAFRFLYLSSLLYLLFLELLCTL